MHQVTHRSLGAEPLTISDTQQSVTEELPFSFIWIKDPLVVEPWVNIEMSLEEDALIT